MYVPESIRFRHEEDEDFYLMNIRWGNTIEVTTLEGEFFIDMQKKRKKFSISDCKFNNTLSRLTGFVAKEALKSDQIDIEVRKTGVNIDPAKLPNLTNPEVLESHPDIIL